MKKIFLLLSVGVAGWLGGNAQTIVKGDMNNDGQLDVSDVTQVVGNILSSTVETIDLTPDIMATNDSALVGSWQTASYEYLTFRNNGTCTDSNTFFSWTYKYYPLQRCVVYYNEFGKPERVDDVLLLPGDLLLLGKNLGHDGFKTYHKCPGDNYLPFAYSLLCNKTDITLERGELFQLQWDIYPDNAVNKDVRWTTNNNSVAWVTKDGLINTGEYAGEAVITGHVLESADVECMVYVTVTPKPSAYGKTLLAGTGSKSWTWDEMLQSGMTVAAWGTSGYSMAAIPSEDIAAGQVPGFWWGFAPSLMEDPFDDPGWAENAYMTFSTDGTVTSYTPDGGVIASSSYGVFEFEEDYNPQYRDALLTTETPALLFPFSYNSEDGTPSTAVTEYKIVNLTEDKMMLLYTNGAASESWSPCTFWTFKAK